MSEHDTKVRRPYRTSPPAMQAKRAVIAGDRLAEDMEASIAAIALNQACGGSKEIAWAADVDDSNARRWARGEPQNPINRARQVVDNAKSPFALAGYFLARACRALLVKDPMPEWRWRSLYMQALRDEAHPDGREDVVTAELLTGQSTLRAQYEADAEHVKALLNRMALGMVGMCRGFKLAGPAIERAH